MHTARLPAGPAGNVAAATPIAIWCPACGDPAASIDRAARRRCAACGTIWLPQRRGYAYDDTYPAERGHHDPMVAHCKQVTLQAWLRRLAMKLAERHVLEVGFGGGATLGWMQARGAQVFGQEPVAANRAAAVAAGIRADRIKPDLADFAGQHVDLVLYLDSFEHLLDAEAHLRCLDALTAPGSRALLVLPVADSLSRRLLGRFWPHDIDDHWVFYSTHGLTRLWRRFGWRPVTSFYPWKFVSLMTIARHVRIMTGIALPLGPLEELGVWLNFGERALVFEKLPADLTLSA
ncbi:MAG TPA: class I SAM-dependent methyltransferase [Acetobacteraceae bacterium]|nr:class I SAM-dependent methyltransferase [Acetobacteraceae bacterium]